MISTLMSMHAYYDGQLNQACERYRQEMIASTQCLKGVHMLSEKTRFLIMMDRKQIQLAKKLKSEKSLIEDDRQQQVRILKGRVNASPWFNSDFRSF